MNPLILALILLTAPRTPCVEIECNTFGYEQQTQYIVIDEYRVNGNTTIHALDWCWAKDAELYRVGGEWVLVNRGRVFVSREFVETCTAADRELEDRKLLAVSDRKRARASVVWEMMQRSGN